MQTVIRVEKLSKTFHHNKALHAVDLTVQQGEMVALLGPSGSGKSTLLRHLSGLITCDKTPESRVELLGNTVQHAGRLASDIRKSRAQTGYIFQQFNLVNRLTVLENVLIGALGSTPFWRTCLRWFSPSQKQEALQALTRVGMAHFAHQRVSTLSGGQQQRVAIARALASSPQIILFDEPTSALDPEMIGEVLFVMKTLAHSGITMIVVTHEMQFAREIADRIVFIDGGKILETAPPAQFFNQPSHPRARRFLQKVLDPLHQEQL